MLLTLALAATPPLARAIGTIHGIPISDGERLLVLSVPYSYTYGTNGTETILVPEDGTPRLIHVVSDERGALLAVSAEHQLLRGTIRDRLVRFELDSSRHVPPIVSIAVSRDILALQTIDNRVGILPFDEDDQLQWSRLRWINSSPVDLLGTAGGDVYVLSESAEIGVFHIPQLDVRRRFWIPNRRPVRVIGDLASGPLFLFGDGAVWSSVLNSFVRSATATPLANSIAVVNDTILVGHTPVVSIPAQSVEFGNAHSRPTTSGRSPQREDSNLRHIGEAYVGDAESDDFAVAVLRILEPYTSYVHSQLRQPHLSTLPGHPMFLGQWASMFVWLSLLVPSSEFESDARELLATVWSQRTPATTWVDNAGQEQVLFSAFFLRVFLDAFEVFGDQSFLEIAEQIAQASTGFRNPVAVATGANPNVFLAIELYRLVNHRPDPRLLSWANELYWLSVRYYEPETGRWYYSPRNQSLRVYSGHDANYQANMLSFLLWNVDAISAVAAPVARHVRRVARNSTDTILDEVTSDLAFEFGPGLPQSTETVGVVVNYLLAVRSEIGRPDNGMVALAVEVLEDNQRPDGGFNRTIRNTADSQPWYGDDAAAFLARAAALRCLSSGR